MLPSKPCLLRIQEALFSLNLAWILVWHERVRSKRQSSLAHYLYTHIRFIEPQTVVEQVCWSLIVGVSIFLLLWLLSKLWTTETLMRTLGGAVSIAGFPLLVVTMPFVLLHRLIIEAYAPIFVFETFLVLLCGGLYHLRKWPVPESLSLVLLFLHFGLWAWVSGYWVSPMWEVRVYGIGSLGIWISTAFYIGFPVLGFLSTLSWALYDRSVPGRFGEKSPLHLKPLNERRLFSTVITCKSVPIPRSELLSIRKRTLKTQLLAGQLCR
jgi:hypothetical protein